MYMYCTCIDNNKDLHVQCSGEMIIFYDVLLF